EACQKSPFLALYVANLPMDEIGVPDYYEKPSRGLGQLENPNLIYPIGEGLHVHIYPDPLGARHHHIAVEPISVVNIDQLLPLVEERLVAWAEEIGRIEDKEEKRALLLSLV